MQCHLINQVHVDRYQSIYLEMNELDKRVSPVHLLGWHCQHISDIRQATTSIAHFCIGLYRPFIFTTESPVFDITEYEIT